MTNESFATESVETSGNVIVVYTDAGFNEFCWWVIDAGGKVIDVGRHKAIGGSLHLEALALAFVLSRLVAMGLHNVVVHWFTDARPIIDMLEGRVRPRKPTMAWVISQITWTAHKHGIKIIPHYDNNFDC